MKPISFDHVALWVAHRDELAGFFCGQMGLHEIDRTDTFTLVGADARLGKLTLFDADQPRERGALQYVALRVGDLQAAMALLPSALPVARHASGLVTFDLADDLRIGLVAGAGVDYDLDHVLLQVPDPVVSAACFCTFGLEMVSDHVVRVADKRICLVSGATSAANRPLLNHLAFLVDSVAAVEQEANERGLEIQRVVDAPNTLAVFLGGPDEISVECVEHKTSFSLT
jgi:catechol 2,3-dioxygenase-like lactoylglutathione lyase family enzyme